MTVKENLKAALDPILEKYTTGDKLPMVVAAVITKDDGLQYLNSAGINDVTNPSDKTANDTVFELFSVTKSVTSTAFLQLLEQGKIASSDDPAELYAEEFRTMKVLEGFDENDNPILVQPTTKVTLRHLLTHTAGFGYAFLDNKSFKWQKKLAEKDPDSAPDILKERRSDIDLPLLFNPGEYFSYGLSLDWVGLIVQNVSNQTLEDYFQEHIFKPLNIENISFIKAKALANGNGYAKLHHRYPQDTPLRLFNHPLPDDPEFHSGGLGLRGPVTDIIKFLEIFLHQGKSPRTGAQILKPETVANYSLKNLFPDGKPMPTVNGGAQIVQPELALESEKPTPVCPAFTASFGQLPIPLPTGRSAGTCFWGGMPRSYYFIDPVKGVLGFWATLVFPYNDKYAANYIYELEAAAYKGLSLV